MQALAECPREETEYNGDMVFTNVTQAQPELISSPVLDVDLWTMPIELQSRKLDDLASLLSAEETQRGELALRHSGYQRYIVARGLLRLVLAKYLGEDPAAIQFEYGSAGKPALAREQYDGGLQFNLAHSGGTAIVAVTRTRNIGVDIEQISVERDFASLGERSLTRDEWAEWSTAPERSRHELFYRFWVRKEAYLKGIGTGLTSPIQHVDVSRSLMQRDLKVTVPYTGGERMPWKIYDLDLPAIGDSTVAALAIADVADQSPLIRSIPCAEVSAI